MINNGLFPNIKWAPGAGGILKNVIDTFKYVPGTIDGTFDRPDGRYELIQFHVHAPSEHRVNGQYFAAEFHCIFCFSDFSCS